MGGLIFVGLGLSGLRDITLRGLDTIRSADIVVAEFYTSRLIGVDVKDIEGLAGKPVRVLGREDIETRGDDLIREAQTKLVAFLVVGDAFSATTHEDLRARAEQARVPTSVIPGVSIFTAAPAAAGLQLYKFGPTTTLPFWQGSYQPSSFYDVIRDNKKRGLHTLVLLDIQAESDRFMKASDAATTLLSVEKARQEGVFTKDSIIVGLARVGAADQRVLAAPADEWPIIDLGPPLHCLIIPGSLHFMEEASLNRFRSAASRSV